MHKSAPCARLISDQRVDRVAGRGTDVVSRRELTEIYQHHRRGLFALALSIIGCPARAEDAVHDAFARLCREPGNTQDVQAQYRVAYVYATVRNAALDQVRRAASLSRAENAGASLFDWQWTNPEGRAIEIEQQRLVARAVETLPPEQREVVMLRTYGDLTFEQIAAITNAPLPTTFARYRRALGKLKQQLEGIA